MRKALFAAVCVTALGLGTSALAQEAGDIDNVGPGSVINGFNETDTSTNVDLDVEDSLNDNSDNSVNTTVEVDDSLNNNSDNSQNTTIDVNDSLNNNSVTRTSTNNQTLTGSVSNVAINFTGGAAVLLGAGGPNSGDFVSGNARTDTSGSFAGVQNAGSNTGFAANALIANGISANANISFGE